MNPPPAPTSVILRILHALGLFCVVLFIMDLVLPSSLELSVFLYLAAGLALAATSLFWSSWWGVVLVVPILLYLLRWEPRQGLQSGMLDDVFVTGLVMLFLVLHSRLTVDSLFQKRTWKQVRQRVRDDIQTLNEGQLNLRAMIRDGIGMIDLAGIRCVSSIAIAFAIMLLVPEDPTSVTRLRLTPGGLRAISIGIALGGVVFIFSTIIRAIGWRRLSPSESRIYLRSEAISSLFVELRSVWKRRIKSRQKRKP